MSFREPTFGASAVSEGPSAQKPNQMALAVVTEGITSTGVYTEVLIHTFMIAFRDLRVRIPALVLPQLAEFAPPTQILRY